LRSSAWHLRRLLVTGGTGYLGQELIRQASECGFTVAATYYSHLPPKRMTASWFPLDIRNAPAVKATFAAFRPDVVIHTAFCQNPPGLWPVTVLGTSNVAQAARSVNAHLIQISSDVIFDGENKVPYLESAAPCPITAYGEAKAEAERIVRAVHPEVAIVRTSLIYGFEPPDRHTQFALQIADGQSNARLFHDEYRCPIFVKDLAAALLEVVQSSYKGLLNIAGNECLSRYEFGQLLAKVYGRDPTAIKGGWSHESPEPRPRNCALDIQLAQQLLQTPLRGVREVLAERL